MSKPIYIFVSGILPNNELIAMKEDALVLASVKKAEETIHLEFPHLEGRKFMFYYKGNLLIILIYLKLKSKMHVLRKKVFFKFQLESSIEIFPYFQLLLIKFSIFIFRGGRGRTEYQN